MGSFILSTRSILHTTQVFNNHLTHAQLGLLSLLNVLQHTTISRSPSLAILLVSRSSLTSEGGVGVTHSDERYTDRNQSREPASVTDFTTATTRGHHVLILVERLFDQNGRAGRTNDCSDRFTERASVWAAGQSMPKKHITAEASRSLARRASDAGREAHAMMKSDANHPTWPQAGKRQKCSWPQTRDPPRISHADRRTATDSEQRPQPAG